MLSSQSHNVPHVHGDLSHHPILLVVVSNGSGGHRRDCDWLLETDWVPLHSPWKYPGTRRLVRSVKVAATPRRIQIKTQNTSFVAVAMMPCDAGMLEEIGDPDVRCRRWREWFILQLSMSGSAGKRFVTRL